jgi:hypothetical protein
MKNKSVSSKMKNKSVSFKDIIKKKYKLSSKVAVKYQNIINNCKKK